MSYGGHLGRLLLLAACGLIACGGDDKSSIAEPPPDGGGTPQNPFDNPTGTPFVLPSSITIQGSLSATDACADAARIGGGTDLVNFCVTLHNAGVTDTIVIFPAGLILVAQDTTVQSGTQVQDQVVLVPAGRDTTLYWTLYCVQLHRHASEPGDVFALGPVSNQTGLREIISLVAGKDLNASFTGISVVQSAIWEVSDGSGLTDSTRAQLQAIP